jgi:hypothetical protein
MLPKLVHLIWLGEDPSGISSAAVEHWRKMSDDRQVIMHRDAAALLPEWQDIWPLAQNASMQSDLLRWSLLLTVGGWYFDCDVRSRLSLNEIEADCGLDSLRCFVTLFGSLATTPVSDILACRPDWTGRQAVIDYIVSQRSMSPYSQLDIRRGHAYRAEPRTSGLVSARPTRSLQPSDSRQRGLRLYPRRPNLGFPQTPAGRTERLHGRVPNVCAFRPAVRLLRFLKRM